MQTQPTLFCRSTLSISLSLLNDLMMTFSLLALQVAICTTLMSPSYTCSIVNAFPRLDLGTSATPAADAKEDV
jgi:hypothetical protein